MVPPNLGFFSFCPLLALSVDRGDVFWFSPPLPRHCSSVLHRNLSTISRCFFHCSSGRSHGSASFLGHDPRALRNKTIPSVTRHALRDSSSLALTRSSNALLAHALLYCSHVAAPYLLHCCIFVVFFVFQNCPCKICVASPDCSSVLHLCAACFRVVVRIALFRCTTKPFLYGCALLQFLVCVAPLCVTPLDCSSLL